MPKFDANISMMFTEVPLERRFQAAADKGFKAVEILVPYQAPASDMTQWAADAGVEIVLINSPMGDREAGERGLAAVPGREAEFREHFDLALEYARTCAIGRIHLMAGVVDAVAGRETFVENVRLAADLVRDEEIEIMLEPLNSFDVPGYFYATTAAALSLIAEIDRPHVKLQFDFYHVQLMEGNIGARIAEHIHQIGHVQFSSVPGRHEPQYGEVNVPYLFERLDELDYDGWVGCEYRPLTTTEAGLAWAEPWGIG